MFVAGEGSQAQFTVREQLAQLPPPNDATVRNTALRGEVTSTAARRRSSWT